MKMESPNQTQLYLGETIVTDRKTKPRSIPKVKLTRNFYLN